MRDGLSSTVNDANAADTTFLSAQEGAVMT